MTYAVLPPYSVFLLHRVQVCLEISRQYLTGCLDTCFPFERFYTLRKSGKEMTKLCRAATEPLLDLDSIGRNWP